MINQNVGKLVTPFVSGKIKGNSGGSSKQMPGKGRPGKSGVAAGKSPNGGKMRMGKC
jgi:hypothetical protein